MMQLRRILTLVAAALFIALGGWLMLDPWAVERLYPITLRDDMAVTEMRAVFGGLMAGVGAAVLWLDLAAKRQRDAAAAMALIFGGLLAARVVGFVGEGIPTGPVLNETVFEFVMFVGLTSTGAFARAE